MLNNILMIQLLLQYGAEESPKIQSDKSRYQSIFHQLSILSEQSSDDSIKKSSSNKLAPDDVQSRRSSPLSDKQQRYRRTSKSQQQHQYNQQRLLTLTQMKDNYEQAAGKKFRSSLVTVKIAVRLLIESKRKKNLEFYNQRYVPDAPTNVRLMVTGSDNITVIFDEPLRSNGAMVIKYKSNI
ncbi:unnamed protein product [Rotaria sp. Silwood1]|nr:unnamed protein product [Rotaria sp. Silwood1]